MQRTSIADPEFTYDAEDPEQFRSGLFRLGGLLGATRTGMSVYEIPPGRSLCPYHYEVGEEEWLLVLSGRATVRHPAGTEELVAWDVVCFRPGAEDAHEVRNDTSEPLRVLMFSDDVYPGATVYPDTDKIGIWADKTSGGQLFRRASAVGYYD